MANNDELNETGIKTSNETQEFVMTADLSKAKKIECGLITNQDSSRREFKPPK